MLLAISYLDNFATCLSLRSLHPRGCKATSYSLPGPSPFCCLLLANLRENTTLSPTNVHRTLLLLLSTPSRVTSLDRCCPWRRWARASPSEVIRLFLDPPRVARRHNPFFLIIFESKFSLLSATDHWLHMCDHSCDVQSSEPAFWLLAKIASCKRKATTTGPQHHKCFKAVD
jgi:hypothetical protein